MQSHENRANQATSYPVKEIGRYPLKLLYDLYMAFERVADFWEFFPFFLVYKTFVKNKCFILTNVSNKCIMVLKIRKGGSR